MFCMSLLHSLFCAFDLTQEGRGKALNIMNPAFGMMKVFASILQILNNFSVVKIELRARSLTTRPKTRMTLTTTTTAIDSMTTTTSTVSDKNSIAKIRLDL